MYTIMAILFKALYLYITASLLFFLSINISGFCPEPVQIFCGQSYWHNFFDIHICI
jgi:hypothetical protein